MQPQKPLSFLIKASFFALLLAALPLPKIALLVSPFWVLLIMIYWVIYFEVKSYLHFCLLLGLLLDLLQGAIFGQNALALIFAITFIDSVRHSFLLSNLSTQQIYVFFAATIYLGILLSVHILTQGLDFDLLVLFSPLVSAIIWAVVRFFVLKN